MAEAKTKATKASVTAFIAAIADEQKQKDARKLVRVMQKISGEKPKMWGPSIIGFGSYHYKYESGREGDMPIVGFSPRSTALTLYVMPGLDKPLLDTLGKHKVGKGCLYIKRLSDVDEAVLEKIIRKAATGSKKLDAKD